MWHRPIIDMLIQDGADVDLETEMYHDGSTELIPLLVSCLLCNQHNMGLIGNIIVMFMVTVRGG
jgi:hypothetical protein